MPFEDHSTDNDGGEPVGSDIGSEAEDSPWEISSESDEELSDAVTFQKVKEQRDSHGNVKIKPSGPEQVEILSSPAPERTEIGQLLISIKFTITSLYKLPLRRPAPIDRLKDRTTDEASCYQPFDVSYVSDKFPRLEAEIATRLGKMITRRRQLLLYRRHHRVSLKTEAVAPTDTVTEALAERQPVINPAVRTTKGPQDQEALKATGPRGPPAGSRITGRSKATTYRSGDSLI